MEREETSVTRVVVCLFHQRVCLLEDISLKLENFDKTKLSTQAIIILINQTSLLTSHAVEEHMFVLRVRPLPVACVTKTGGPPSGLIYTWNMDSELTKDTNRDHV